MIAEPPPPFKKKGEGGGVADLRAGFEVLTRRMRQRDFLKINPALVIYIDSSSYGAYRDGSFRFSFHPINSSSNVSPKAVRLFDF